MWVSRYVVWLVVYGVLGWIYESTYCTIVDRRWENRGFLYGPICPIYGVAVVIMMALWQLVEAQGLAPDPWEVFVLAAVGSAVLEYATSWGLEKVFHARWWDYANMPLNLNGRICLPASLLFGFMGMFVVYVLYDPTVGLTDALPPAAVEALSLVLVALASADTALTVAALTRFAQIAATVNETVNDRMDKLVGDAMERSGDAAEMFAQERDRLAAQVRASKMGEASRVVSSAVRRVRSFSPSFDVASPLNQLEALRKAFRAQK